MDITNKCKNFNFFNFFKLLISEDGLIVNSPAVLNNIFLNKNLVDFIKDSKEKEKFIRSVKKSINRNIKTKISLSLCFNNYTIEHFKLIIKPKLDNVSKKLLKIYLKNEEPSFLNIENLSIDLEKENIKSFKKLLNKICKILYHELNLENFFIFNINNKYMVNSFDFMDFATFKYLTYEDIDFVKKLEDKISYDYYTNEEFDIFIDQIFANDLSVFTTEEFMKILEKFKIVFGNLENVTVRLNKILQKQGVEFFILIPVVTKNVRTGFYVILKPDKITKSEKNLLAELRNKIAETLINDNFYKKYLLQLDDVSYFDYKLPQKMYQLLYEFSSKFFIINNLNEAKIYLSNALKNITNSNYAFYFNVDFFNEKLIPFFISDEEKFKGIVDSSSISTKNKIINNLVSKRSVLVLNTNSVNSLFLVENFPFLKDLNYNLLLTVVYDNQNNIAGIIFLLKSTKYFFIDSSIVSTIAKKYSIKHKELFLEKENYENKLKYKNLYEAVASLNSTTNLQSSLDLISRIFGNLISVEYCIFYKLDGDKKYLIPIFSNEKIEKRVKTFDRKIKIGEYIIGKACADGITRFQNIEDYEKDIDPSFDKTPKSILAIPLVINNEIFGGVILSKHYKPNFTSDDFELIMPFYQQSINLIYQDNLFLANKKELALYKDLLETMVGVVNANNSEDFATPFSKQLLKTLNFSNLIFYFFDDKLNSYLLNYLYDVDNKNINYYDNVLLTSDVESLLFDQKQVLINDLGENKYKIEFHSNKEKYLNSFIIPILFNDSNKKGFVVLENANNENINLIKNSNFLRYLREMINIIINNYITKLISGISL